MSLEQIGWEYINGVPYLVALGNLLEVAILEVIPESKVKKSGGWHWRGFYLNGAYFCGVRYDKPLVVVFENNNGNDPSYKQDLNLNDAHFFSLSQAEQLECFAEFIRDSYSDITEK